MEKDLEQKFNSISSWEEWNEFEIKHFNIPDWPMQDNDVMDQELSRPIILKDNVEWRPFSFPYSVPFLKRFQYEYYSMKIFEKLEPHNYLEMIDFGDVGKACYHCLMYTKNYEVKLCSFCNLQLVDFPLNEKN